MLCEACEEHLQLDFDWSIGYLRLKTNIVSFAEEHLEDPSQVKLLQLDLRRYEQAVLTHRDIASKAPCPWFRGDVSKLSWRTTDSFEEDYFMRIWDKPRQGRDVRLTASAGCEICLRLSAIISHMPSFGHISTVRFQSWLHFHPISLKPWYIRFLAQRPFHHEWLYFWVVEEQGNVSNDVAFRQPTGSSSDDAQCTEFLYESLKICLRDHPSCRSSNPQNWIPSRLLDVQQNNAVSDSVCLVERNSILTANRENYIRYLTLSHIWGDEKFLTLTKDNLEEFKAGISLDTLPQCFQDAIAMARRLCVRYLWIDSLCIKQDTSSAEDWHTEAATMDKVYLYSLCNLASCNSKNPREGFFSQRNAKVGGTFPVKWDWLDYSARFMLFFDWFDIVNRHSPLYQRGWVVQERLISPRTMHFNIFPFWECHEMVTCEAYPTQLHGKRYKWLPKPDNKLLESDENPELAWLRIIEHYSSCDLTRSCDKLVALSGIARLLSGSIGGSYVAGLWKNNLLQGLLWQVQKQVSGDDMAAERSEEYVAPSWSWASINGPIHTRCHEVSAVLAEIIAIRVDSVNQNPFGALKGGVLTIHGMLFELPLPWALFDRHSYKASQAIDDWALGIDDIACVDQRNATKTFFLPIVDSPDASEKFNLTICGILIQRVQSHRDSPVFKRVGFAIVSQENGHIANTGWFLKKWKSPPWPKELERTIEII